MTSEPTSFPSFNSFPELDPGPSNRSSSRSKQSRNNDKNESRRKKDKHGSTTLNDGFIKSDEDRKSKLKDTSDSKPPLYYSDRKGDRLNVTYGTLHAGNVPKYRPINGMHAFPWYRAAYGRLIYRRKTNIGPGPGMDCCTQGSHGD